jgi:rhamnosyltransferase
MKASVIIPTLNGGELLLQVARALVVQEFKYKWEVVIIDSDSVDDSTGNVSNIFSASKIPHKIIRIPSKEFQHGASRNLAISKAEGEIVCLLTQDAIPANSQWLNEITKPFFEDVNICGVFGRHIAHKGHPRLISRDLSKHFDYMNTQKVRFISNQETYDTNTTLRQFLHFFSNNNSALRKKTWEQLPFPEVDFGEDQVWAKLILEDSGFIVYEDSAKVMHSHVYGFKKSIERVKTEIKFYRQHFGYDLSRPKISFVPTLVKSFIKDFLWLCNEKSLNFKEIFFSFKKHFTYNIVCSFVDINQ